MYLNYSIGYNLAKWRVLSIMQHILNYSYHLYIFVYFHLSFLIKVLDSIKSNSVVQPYNQYLWMREGILVVDLQSEMFFFILSFNCYKCIDHDDCIGSLKLFFLQDSRSNLLKPKERLSAWLLNSDMNSGSAFGQSLPLLAILSVLRALGRAFILSILVFHIFG